MKLIVFVLICCSLLALAGAFMRVHPSVRLYSASRMVINNPRKYLLIQRFSDISETNSEESIPVTQSNLAIRKQIESVLDKHRIVLFMKGTKLKPQCGFSRLAAQILTSMNVEFHDVDVLADDNVRHGIKEYSKWPTIPQLYIDKEFIGGSDIMLEMFNNGELEAKLRREDFSS